MSKVLGAVAASERLALPADSRWFVLVLAERRVLLVSLHAGISPTACN
jgi:hypothetical protein